MRGLKENSKGKKNEKLKRSWFIFRTYANSERWVNFPFKMEIFFIKEDAL